MIVCLSPSVKPVIPSPRAGGSTAPPALAGHLEAGQNLPQCVFTYWQMKNVECFSI